MTNQPSDRQLDRLLAELPRASASPGFSRRVLAQVEDNQPSLVRPGWLLVSAAAAAALALAIWLLPQTAPEPSLAETRALEEEHRLLMKELQSLKASLRDTRRPPGLYLGGNEQLELVLDLEPIWRGEPATETLPAVHGATLQPHLPSGRNTGDRR